MCIHISTALLLAQGFAKQPGPDPCWLGSRSWLGNRSSHGLSLDRIAATLKQTKLFAKKWTLKKLLVLRHVAIRSVHQYCIAIIAKCSFLCNHQRRKMQPWMKFSYMWLAAKLVFSVSTASVFCGCESSGWIVMTVEEDTQRLLVFRNVAIRSVHQCYVAKESQPPWNNQIVCQDVDTEKATRLVMRGYKKCPLMLRHKHCKVFIPL